MSDQPGPQSGQTLGRARAIIELVSARFVEGARIVQRVSLETQKTIEGLGKSTDTVAGAFGRAKKAAQDFDNSSLGKIQQGLKGVRDQLTLVSAAAAGISLFGVAQAREMARVNTQFAVLLGSQKLATAEMAKLTKFAEEFNLPVSEVLKAGANLLPVVNATGASIDKLIIASSKLGQLDPAQGFSGAQTAIKEFLAGDVTSLYRRFELGITKSQYKKLLEDAHGDADAALEGLNELISATGLTDEAFKKMNEADPFPVLLDNIKTALAEGFTPLLKALVPIAQDFAKWVKEIKETNPELLKIGAGLTVVVAAGAPLLTFLTTAISLFKGLKVAASALNLGKTATQIGEAAAGAGRLRDAQGRFLPAGQGAPDATAPAGAASVASKGAFAGAGVIAAGVVSGVAVGTIGAKVLADRGVRTGDLGRIADGENPLAILAQRIVQGLVVISTAFVGKLTEFLNTFLKALATVKSAIEQFVNVFKLGGAILGEAFGNLRIMFGKFIEAIGGLIGSIPGQEIRGQEIRGAGLAEQKAGGELTTTSSIERRRIMEELAKGVQPSAEDLANIDKATQDIRDSIVGVYFDIYDTLYPLPEQVKPIFDNTSKVVKEGVEKIAGDSTEYLEEQAKEIADATQSYNDDITAMETKKQQDLIGLNEKFAQEQIQIAQDRVKAERAALESLQEDLRKFDTELTRDIQKEGRERARKNIELEIEFQRTELADAEAHRDKLLKIEADYRKKQSDALENFDFATLFDLSEQVKEQTDEANTEYDAQRRERVQSLQYEREDLVREFGAQREERLIQYEQNRVDRQAEYEKDRAKIITDTAERQQLAAQAHTAELAQLNSKYTNELTLRQQAFTAELNLLMQTEQQRLAIMAQTQEMLLQQAYSFANRARPGSSSGAVSTRDYSEQIAQTQRQSRIAQDARNNELASQGRRVSGYAGGGTALAGHTYLVNELSPERFRRGAQIHNLPNNAGLFTPLDDGSVMPNRGGASRNGMPTITVQVNLNGAVNTAISLDEALPLIEQVAKDGAETALTKWMGNYER